MNEESLWQRIWQAVLGVLPEPIGGLPEWALLAIAAAVGLVVVFILIAILGGVLRLLFGKRKSEPTGPSLEEHLATYPPLKAGSGDRRLQVEGVPVRLRLIVLAPAGKESH